MPQKNITLLGTVLAAALQLFPLSLQAQEIGTTALVVATVTGTPPNQPARQLSLGTGVVQDEEITTASGARAEVLFLDETSLSMGENTSIVLDRFVFDPNAGSGELALSLSRGVLRFIGGKVSDGQPALVTTPTATIGIRGSSAIVSTNGQQSIVVFVAGNELCLTPNGTSQPICTAIVGGVLTERGFVGQVDPATLANLLAAIDGINAANGNPPTTVGDLDLTQVVDSNGVPYATSGGQNENDGGGDQGGDGAGGLPNDGASYTPEGGEGGDEGGGDEGGGDEGGGDDGGEGECIPEGDFICE